MTAEGVLEAIELKIGTIINNIISRTLTNFYNILRRIVAFIKNFKFRMCGRYACPFADFLEKIIFFLLFLQKKNKMVTIKGLPKDLYRFQEKGYMTAIRVLAPIKTKIGEKINYLIFRPQTNFYLILKRIVAFIKNLKFRMYGRCASPWADFVQKLFFSQF